MFNLLSKLAINFLSWNLRKLKIDNLEVIIRSDGATLYKRNKEKENSIQMTLDCIC